MRTKTQHHARAAAVLAAALSVLIITGCAATGSSVRSTPAAVSAPRSTPTPTASSGPAIPRTDVRIDHVAQQQVVAPTHISMPSLSIDMEINPVGLDPEGGLEIPADSNEAGWYQYGPGMLTPTGSVVLAAHIDSWNGIGPFSRIKDASAGSPVILTAAGKSRSFAVTEVEQTPKLGEALSAIFTKSGPPRLIMVTCGGVFNSDTGHYLDNVILIATPTGN